MLHVRMFWPLVFTCLLVFANGEHVEELNPSNFQASVAAKPATLVMFYAPWCGHCKKLKPHLESAAAKLAVKEPKIKVARLDCDAHGDFCGKEQVTGYPTVKFYKDGQFSSMFSGRSEAEIISFLLARSKPESVELTSKDHYATVSLSDTPVVAAFLKAGSTELDEFKKAATELLGKVDFFHTHDASVLGVAGDQSSIVLTRPKYLHAKFEESTISYNGVMEMKDLKAWILDNSHGLIGYLGESEREFFPTDNLLVFYHEAARDTALSMVRYYRNRIAAVVKDSGIAETGMRIAYAPVGEHMRELNDLSITPQEFPAVLIRSGGKKYLLKSYSKDLFVEFLNNFKAGTLSPHIKSEAIPTSDDGAVKTVVALNFEDVVNDPTKDVFVMFHAPWCGHCKSLKPIFTSAAEELVENKDVIFVMFDATANDVPAPYSVRGFPTLYFVPKAAKSSPILYSGERTKDALIKHVAKHSADELASHDRSGKKRKDEL